MLRAQVKANSQRLESIERHINQNQPSSGMGSTQFSLGPDAFSNNDLADLQRQLDNVTQVTLVDFQRRLELLFTDIKNDLKRLEEKTSRWLQDANADYIGRIAELSKDVGRLAQVQAGMFHTNDEKFD